MVQGAANGVRTSCLFMCRQEYPVFRPDAAIRDRIRHEPITHPSPVNIAAEAPGPDRNGRDTWDSGKRHGMVGRGWNRSIAVPVASCH